MSWQNLDVAALHANKQVERHQKLSAYFPQIKHSDMAFSLIFELFQEYQKVGLFFRFLSAIGLFSLFCAVLSLKRFVFEVLFLRGINVKTFQIRSGAWAIVTGASEGIGREFSLQLSRYRFNLVLIARSKDKLEALSKEIETLYSVKTIVHIMDFSVSDDRNYEILKEIIQDLDIKILVNNVGLSHTMPTPFSLTTPKEIQDITTINCIATLKTTNLVVPGMIRRLNDQISFIIIYHGVRKSGLILTMGSFSGIMPTPLLATYSGSKAFLTTWSQALAEELKHDGITVQLINSYFVVSSMSKIRKPSFFVPTPKQFVNSALNSIGLQRGAATPYTMTPYPSHSILNWLLENVAFKLSRSLVLKQNFKELERIRKKALQKLNTSSK